MALDPKLINDSLDIFSELNQMKNTAKRTGRCALCKSDKTQANDFKDDLSRREYKISFTCQKCQDSFWDKVFE